MKNPILFFAFILTSLSAYAQDLAGRKIIQGSFSVNINSTKTSHLNSYDASLRFGKIKPNNTYIAWGGNFNGTSSDSEFNSVGVEQFKLGPSFDFGKFIPLVDRFYLAPHFGGTVQAVFGNSKGVAVGAYAVPLRFLYNFSNHFMFSASLGSANLNFSRIEKATNLSLNGSLNNNTGFGVFYTFK